MGGNNQLAPSGPGHPHLAVEGTCPWSTSVAHLDEKWFGLRAAVLDSRLYSKYI